MYVLFLFVHYVGHNFPMYFFGKGQNASIGRRPLRTGQALK